MKLNKNAVVVVSAMILFGGCASDNMDKKLSQKVATEPTISTSAEFESQAQAAIDNDKHLSADQKTKLTQLRTDSNAKMKSLRLEALKLREALLSDFIAQNDQEIDVIHDQLKQNYNQQVSVIFDTVSKANKIIGHIPRNRQWLDEMMLESHEAHSRE